MNVICLEEEAFFTLLEKTIETLSGGRAMQDPKWIDDQEAMDIVEKKSKQRMRNNYM